MSPDGSLVARRELVNALRAQDEVQEVDFTRDCYKTVVVWVDDQIAATAARETGGAAGYEHVRTVETGDGWRVVLSLSGQSSSERVRCGGNRL